MDYADRLENVTVLGAAGKMGSGIVLLTAVELADLGLRPENRSRLFVLNAVDVSQAGLAGLLGYLRAQARKIAEKKIVSLRRLYADRADLVENGEIIDQYVLDVLKTVRPGTAVEASYDSTLVLEAVSEDTELKVGLLSRINQNSSRSPWFFSNTSSIPIHELDERAGLKGRILGFHFYNPPAVQKLVELIVTDRTRAELQEFARAFAKNLRKTVVSARDVAGFIGNGHFMREILYAVAEVDRLAAEDTLALAPGVYCLNRISQEFLIRPMGIFQLADYVGIDVCRSIMRIMDLPSPLLERLLELGVKGGQDPQGSQRDGLLRYERGRPAGVFDPEKKEYRAISDFKEEVDRLIGPLPASALPWKQLVADPEKAQKLSAFFRELGSLDTLGAKLARRYAEHSRKVALNLVAEGVAAGEEDVNTVLLTGFYHAYGPINDYLQQERKP